MELSQKAMDFSIDSLLSASSSVSENHNRFRSAEIYSRANNPKQAAARAGQDGDASVLDRESDTLICRATSLLKKISMQDKTGNTDAPPSSLSRAAFTAEVPNFVCERSVRRKMKKNDYLYSGEQTVREISINQRDGLEGPPGESRGRLQNMVLGIDYKLKEPPQGEPEFNWLPQEDSWKTGDVEPDGGGVLSDEPLSQIVNGIQVTLENASLWKMFNKCGTEMIINRIGRRMFPCIVITVGGMEHTSLYRIQMVLDSSNRRRYKFINGRWLPVGKADPEPPNEPFEHPDSPNMGAFWMQDKVSFAKLKITNNKEAGKPNTVLHSMHKYTPRIIITKLGSSADERGIAPLCLDTNLSTEGGLSHHHHQLHQHHQQQQWQQQQQQPATDGNHGTVCFEFKENAFIAVTAYHSEQITQLKIQNNPFAKAFRDADVTAILQGTHMPSTVNEPTRFPHGSAGLMSRMHPGFPSIPIAWQHPPSMRANQLDSDPSGFSHTPNDTPYRQGRPVIITEFPDSRWSLDNISLLRPSGTYGMNPNAEATTSTSPQRIRRLPRYRSHPIMTFDTATKLPMTSRNHEGQHHSIGALQEVKVNRSLSEPEINFERVSAGQQTSTTSQFSEFNQAAMGNTGDGTYMYHPLRRVSSSAVSRPIKRHSLPHLSSKKAFYIPRHRSADKLLRPASTHSRRHSFVDGSPLLSAPSPTECPRE